MAVTVAQGVVVVEADASKVGAGISKSLTGAQPAVERSGKQVGDGFTQAFSATTKDLGKDTLEKLKSSVESTAKRMESARDKEADAAGKVRIAEKLLADAREKNAADSAKVIRAEEQLESALRSQKAAQRNAQDATEDNTRALGRFGDAARDAANKSDRAADDIANDGERAGRGWVDSFKGSFLGNALAGVALGAAQQIGDIIGTGIRAAWDFGWSSIDVASGLNEADTALASIFGEGKGAVDAFAESAARNVGQSELAAKKGAQTFGVYGKAAGLAGKENAEFSTGLVTLAADFASFYDTSPEQAIEAIGAALRGESEPIRTYGVLLDDATLKARAMSMGLLGTSVDMTKVSGAQLKLESAQKKVNDATAKYGPDSLEAREAMQRVTEAQEALAAATEGATSEALTPQQRALAAHAEILAQADVASGDFANTSSNLANQQRILAAQFEDSKAKLGESLLPIMSEVVTFLNDDFMPVFGQIIDEVGPELGQALVDAMPAVKDFLLAFVENLPAITEFGSNALPVFIEAGNLLIPVLAFMTENGSALFGIMGGLLSLLKGDTSLPEFRDKMQELPGPLGTIMQGAQNVGTAFGLLGNFAERTGGIVKASIITMGITIAELPGKVQSALANAGTWLYNSGRSIIQGFIDGIRSMFVNVGTAVANVVNSVRDYFPNSPAKKGVFSGAGWTRLKESGGAVIDQWAEGMREASPGVPFDLMGIAAPAGRSTGLGGSAYDVPASASAVRTNPASASAGAQFRDIIVNEAEDPLGSAGRVSAELRQWRGR